MKKLLSIVISLIMILGATTLFACDATFDGNYKKADAEQTKAFIEQVESEGDPTATESTIEKFLSGMEMSLNFNMKRKDNNAKITAEVKSALIGEENEKELLLAAKAEISGDSEEVPAGKYEAYATDGKIYFSMQQKGKNEQKAYVSLTYEELSGMLTPGMISEFMPSSSPIGLESVLTMIKEPSQLQAALGGEDAVKFYIDEESNKLKVELNADVNMLGVKVTIKGSVFAAFDETFKLAAIKADLNVKSSVDEATLKSMGLSNDEIAAAKATAVMDISVNFVLKGYTGTVNVPANFEGYEEEDLDTIMEAVMG